MKNILIILFFQTTALVWAQCPTIDFSIPTEVCINESFLIDNSSTGASSFEWNFCSGFISEPGNLFYSETITSLNNAFGVDLVEQNGSFYSFIVNRANGTLIRIDHGNSIDNSYDVNIVSVSGDVFNSPQGITLHTEGGVWYGLVSTNSGEFFRLSFGNDISISSVTSSSLGGCSSSNGSLRCVFTGDTFSIYGLLNF